MGSSAQILRFAHAEPCSQSNIQPVADGQAGRCRKSRRLMADYIIFREERRASPSGPAGRRRAWPAIGILDQSHLHVVFDAVVQLVEQHPLLRLPRCWLLWKTAAGVGSRRACRRVGRAETIAQLQTAGPSAPPAEHCMRRCRGLEARYAPSCAKIGSGVRPQPFGSLSAGSHGRLASRQIGRARSPQLPSAHPVGTSGSSAQTIAQPHPMGPRTDDAATAGRSPSLLPTRRCPGRCSRYRLQLVIRQIQRSSIAVMWTRKTVRCRHRSAACGPTTLGALNSKPFRRRGGEDCRGADQNIGTGCRAALGDSGEIGLSSDDPPGGNPADVFSVPRNKTRWEQAWRLLRTPPQGGNNSDIRKRSLFSCVSPKTKRKGTVRPPPSFQLCAVRRVRRISGVSRPWRNRRRSGPCPPPCRPVLGLSTWRRR